MKTSNQQTAATAEAFVSYYRPDPLMDAPTVVQQLKKPVLVIAASADTVVTDLPQKMEGVADGERVQFELFNGADHSFRGLWAEDIGDLATDFIGEL
ncbi:MAG: dienelactone hydrolase family protein [Gammaproteobacteria bacterium]|nr:dienelactone hydrolase family protein [Gammaproteobacteria bacterium]MCW8973913.1 dienelactone hydrolase family protein [Gammaproteobacteria bacterium]MCW8992914.1 dienelactone hydrolase family protein [Gammaproteobacteria bacterium]